MIKIGNIELPDFPLLLAPMEDVSDPPFRRLCKMHGADMMYSEFISSEGLIRDAIKSRMKLDILIMKDLLEFRFLEEMRRQWPYLKSLQQFDLI
jgi:tRNA-dihydrouridine synthase